MENPNPRFRRPTVAPMSPVDKFLSRTPWNQDQLEKEKVPDEALPVAKKLYRLRKVQQTPE